MDYLKIVYGITYLFKRKYLFHRMFVSINLSIFLIYFRFFK